MSSGCAVTRSRRLLISTSMLTRKMCKRLTWRQFRSWESDHLFFLKDFKKAAYSSGAIPAFVSALMVRGSFDSASTFLGVSA